MARAGDVLYSPTFGERIQFVKTAADTHGELLEMEATNDPNQEWESGVEHYHPQQDEHFEVLEGVLSVMLDGQEHTYVAGEQFDIPCGVVHNMRNRSSKPVRFRWQVRPALNTETFFETVWGLSADGKLTPGTLSYLLQFAVLLQAYRQVFRVTTPSPLMQRILFGILAATGRLMGYRARYAKYSRPQIPDERAATA